VPKDIKGNGKGREQFCEHVSQSTREKIRKKQFEKRCRRVAWARQAGKRKGRSDVLQETLRRVATVSGELGGKRLFLSKAETRSTASEGYSFESIPRYQVSLNVYSKGSRVSASAAGPRREGKSKGTSRRAHCCGFKGRCNLRLRFSEKVAW